MASKLPLQIWILCPQGEEQTNIGRIFCQILKSLKKIKVCWKQREMHKQVLIRTDKGKRVGSLHHLSSLRIDLTVISELLLIMSWGRELAFVAF